MGIKESYLIIFFGMPLILLAAQLALPIPIDSYVYSVCAIRADIDIQLFITDTVPARNCRK